MDMKTVGHKPVLRGELTLLLAVLVNSVGVRLMLYSGSGIPAISSVPYAIYRVTDTLTLGTWTYLFQGCLVLSLMVLRRRFVPSYLFSFVVGFVSSNLLDFHALWISTLPATIPLRVVYFVISYGLICFSVTLANRCRLPIAPIDLFPRELAAITGVPYSKIKCGFDLLCLLTTAVLTVLLLGYLDGLGIGTLVSALTMGRGVGWLGDRVDRRFSFVSVLEPSPLPAQEAGK